MKVIRSRSRSHEQTTQCYPATPRLKWEHDYNCRDSEHIASLRGSTQRWQWKMACVISVLDYTNMESPQSRGVLWIFIGLPYITKYTHSWVVCLRLEGSLVSLTNNRTVCLSRGQGHAQRGRRATASSPLERSENPALGKPQSHYVRLWLVYINHTLRKWRRWKLRVPVINEPPCTYNNTCHCDV